jgi:transcriptional regulator with XRE-family HTH domain
MADEPEGDTQAGGLGGYIRLQRQLADLSLRQLSDLTKVSNAYLSQVERGLHQPSLRVLRSIADALNLSSDTLLSQAGMRSCAIPSSGRRSARRCSAYTAACGDPLVRDPDLDPVQDPALDILSSLLDM